jgi:hypothetical protein
MDKKLIQKLLLNALSQLNRYYGNEGCNDLSKNHPLLKNISPEEFEIIEKEWAETFPDNPYEDKLLMDTCLIDLVKKSVETESFN